ncbi:hypothetical protein MIZ01_0553 [Sideroxyarcus emersonii]|uniref:DUF3800 domain-containing protein n=1 Tax=Sideroxyarcus emersonii TaxID=2764705 RepID=A0AAN1X8B5_9PROT|nr:DUF3800 domain-containing protein [Sideroxyarcus emersonii]BCK86787.1 hypothetical protein MIZ01_0553 [Sideroxyarcus emersonii]
MKTFDIGDIRKYTKRSAPLANFDGAYTFYYDETNNIRKFHVREFDFNSAFTDNFVLGGLVHEGTAPDVQSLIDSFNLQDSVKEVKFKHIAKGDFLDCMKSQRLTSFFRFIGSNDLYVHYSSINILYWSIVDIVDSAISHSEISQQLGPPFANMLKNDLYKLSKIEIDSMISLFRRFGYPNIKQDEVLPFIESISNLFVDYLDDMEFHLGLESLRQILKEAKNKGSLPFVTGEEDFVLIRDFSQFYLRPICIFKNSTHIFDNENSIAESLAEYKILDGSQEIRNYSFVNSQSNQFTQLSDILVGVVGKLHSYLNTSTRDKIQSDFCKLNTTQTENIDLFLNSIDESHDKNMGFLHSTDSYEEMSKFEVIRESRIRA